jgi:hypothetical protein
MAIGPTMKTAAATCRMSKITLATFIPPAY